MNPNNVKLSIFRQNMDPCFWCSKKQRLDIFPSLITFHLKKSANELTMLFSLSFQNSAFILHSWAHLLTVGAEKYSKNCLYNNYYNGDPFSIFKTQNNLRKGTTSQQRPRFLGQDGDCCTQVWLQWEPHMYFWKVAGGFVAAQNIKCKQTI